MTDIVTLAERRPDRDCIELSHHISMRAGWQGQLYERMIEAKRHAERDETMAAFQAAGKAYRDYVRSFLTDPERRVFELEDELIRLRAELRSR